MSPNIEIDTSAGDWTHDCDCCGLTTRRIAAFVHNESGPYAVYFANWSIQEGGHRPEFMILFGNWGGDDTTARFSVALDCGVMNGTIGARVIDAASTAWTPNAEMMGHASTRDEVMAGPARQQSFDIFDAALESDPRLPFVEWGWWAPPDPGAPG